MSSHPGHRHRRSVVYRALKRVLDVTIAALLLAVTAPVLLVVAGLIRWRLGSPIFFRQERIGLGGRPFELVKFRTMRNAWDRQGHPLPDAARLTRLGQFLRHVSLDEFPQLWNVLRGEMSLVGPRPLLARYLPRYSPAQMRRHDVMPGMTGWAQVHGRNAISWDERFALDLWYVDHASLLLDLQILLRTALRVLIPSGISAREHVTMPEFEGNRSPRATSPAESVESGSGSCRSSATASHP